MYEISVVSFKVVKNVNRRKIPIISHQKTAENPRLWYHRSVLTAAPATSAGTRCPLTAAAPGELHDSSEVSIAAAGDTTTAGIVTFSCPANFLSGPQELRNTCDPKSTRKSSGLQRQILQKQNMPK